MRPAWCAQRRLDGVRVLWLDACMQDGAHSPLAAALSELSEVGEPNCVVGHFGVLLLRAFVRGKRSEVCGLPCWGLLLAMKAFAAGVTE